MEAGRGLPEARGRDIFLDSLPLARLRVESAEEFNIEGKLSLVASLGLPRAEIEAEPRAAGNNESGVQWG